MVSPFKKKSSFLIDDILSDDTKPILDDADERAAPPKRHSLSNRTSEFYFSERRPVFVAEASCSCYRPGQLPGCSSNPTSMRISPPSLHCGCLHPMPRTRWSPDYVCCQSQRMPVSPHLVSPVTVPPRRILSPEYHRIEDLREEKPTVQRRDPKSESPVLPKSPGMILHFMLVASHFQNLVYLCPNPFIFQENLTKIYKNPFVLKET